MTCGMGLYYPSCSYLFTTSIARNNKSEPAVTYLILILLENKILINQSRNVHKTCRWSDLRHGVILNISLLGGIPLTIDHFDKG